MSFKRHVNRRPRGVLTVAWIMTSFIVAAAALRADPPGPLAGSDLLVSDEPLDRRMMADAHRFIEGKINEAIAAKDQFWQRDFASPQAYDQSIAGNRQRLAFILGIQSAHPPTPTHLALPPAAEPPQMLRIGDDTHPVPWVNTGGVAITRVRWPVCGDASGEGLLLEPAGDFTASIVVIPDANQTPEQLAGIGPDNDDAEPTALMLARAGARVLVPALIDRRDVTPDGELGQSSREWIYRQAFHMGRHILGYEIDTVTAAIDWFEKTHVGDRPVGLVGSGEGSFIALYAAALDTRVDATLIRGDWVDRGPNWREPIYRNVWALMSQFDDADLATMVAPRTLIAEQTDPPAIDAIRDKAMPRGGGAEVTPVPGLPEAATRLRRLAPRAPPMTRRFGTIG